MATLHYQTLESIGFSKYCADIFGNCYTGSDHELVPRNSHGKFILWRIVDGVEVRRLIGNREAAVAAWSSLDKIWWSSSPFAQDIEIYKKGFVDLPAKDKIRLPFINRDGTGYWVTREGRVWRETDMREMSYPVGSSGYVNLRLGNADNVRLHRLVAHYFCDVPSELLNVGFKEENLVVNHIDGNKINNRADNLEWVTNKQNADHARKNSLLKTTIDNDILETVWKMLQDGKTNKEISAVTNIPEPTVSNIRNGASPRYKTDKYHWLTNKELIEQRQLKYVENFNSGLSVIDICNKYNTSATAVRRSLKIHADKVTREMQHQDKSHVTELTPELLTQIFEALVAHESVLSISRRLGVSVNQINAIKSRRTYRKEGLSYIWEEDGNIADDIIRHDTKIATNEERLRRMTMKIGAAFHQGYRTAKAIAERIGSDRKTVDRLARRVGLKLEESTASLFTQDELNQIFTMLQEGKPDNYIAEQMGVDPQRISGIRSRNRYADASKGWIWESISPRKFDTVE